MSVDIYSLLLFCSGVNMFAMVTGNLPYNMERFNIIDMYHKMMERRMMPFPSQISPGKVSNFLIHLSSLNVLPRGKTNFCMIARTKKRSLFEFQNLFFFTAIILNTNVYGQDRLGRLCA